MNASEGPLVPGEHPSLPWLHLELREGVADLDRLAPITERAINRVPMEARH